MQSINTWRSLTWWVVLTMVALGACLSGCEGEDPTIGASRIDSGRPVKRFKKETNWLPAPKTSPFKLALRLYIPQKSVLDEDWVPPAIQRAD